MSAVLSISAVDPATDQITVTAHGLNTGDGPAAVYTPDGAIPGGLAAVTDYWVIKVDANTLKLASSSSNAVAGTAIDITDAGSGTLQLLLGLPYRRNTTYAVKSQLKSADLNAIQDSLVALWNGAHAAETLSIPASAVGMDDSTASFTRGAGSMVWLAGHNAVASVPLAKGERIQGVRAYVADTSGSTIGVSLASTDHTGTVTPIAGATSSGAGGAQTLTFPSGFPADVGGALSLQFTTAGSGTLTVYSVEIDYDHP